MVEVDYMQLQKMVEQAVKNADTFNKVWIALGAVCVSILSLLIGASTQVFVAYRQRLSQEGISARQTETQKRTAEQQLVMQELASKRTAVANIAAKRQIWIDEFRKDIAAYLCAWREITYRRQALVDNHRNLEVVPPETINEFIAVVGKLRMQAYELAIRIQLRTNPNEDEHSTLRKMMEELEELEAMFSHSLTEVETEELSDVVHNRIVAITELSQGILKAEWERLKKESYVDPGV